MKAIIVLLIFSIISSKIIQKNRQFIDSHGRTRIFHGVNIVYKLPPYYPIEDKFDPYKSFSDEDLKYFKQLGFNLVRLGVMWEGIETAPGVYNETLLDKYLNLVNKLGAHGIFTIIDSHQDLFSRVTCGEGVPVFYVRELDYEKDCNGNLFKRFLKLIGICHSFSDFSYEKDNEGLPLLSECKRRSFPLYYNTADVTSLFNILYTNHKGLLDKFIDYWGVVLKKFKFNPYVIGIDIMNEFFPGNVYDDPWIKMKPGGPDNLQLLPFYRTIENSLRKIDPDYTLMFQSTNIPDILPFLNNFYIGEYHTTPIEDESNLEKQMFNFHPYCCISGFDICKNGEPSINNKDFCRNFIGNIVEHAERFSKKFKIGSIITEFGACSNTQACYNEMTSVTDAADKHMIIKILKSSLSKIFISIINSKFQINNQKNIIKNIF